MASRREAIDRSQQLMERAEAAAARQIAQAYNAARRELIATLIEGWTGAETLTPAEASDLLRRLGLLEQIDRRLAELERTFGLVLRDVIVASEDRGLAAVRRDLALLPAEMRPSVDLFARINTQLVERFLPVALDEAQLATAALRSQLRRELQAGLIQGEAFPRLVRRLMTVSEPSVFRNGRTSAERAVRRLVITAENAARHEHIGQARAEMPELRRQAVAVVASNTTATCLHVHGQIVDVDQPFDLGGYEPQFTQFMMYPAFHWNCRTAVTAWHPRFESGGLNTANMERSAQAELRKRRN